MGVGIRRSLFSGPRLIQHLVNVNNYDVKPFETVVVTDALDELARFGGVDCQIM